MLSTAEIWSLIRRLLALTRDKKMFWLPYLAETNKMDVHESLCAFGKFLVYVSSVDGDGLPPIRIEVFKDVGLDANQRVGDYSMAIEPTDDEEGRAGLYLHELYNLAWPQAYGVANLFDEIDGELRLIEGE